MFHEVTPIHNGQLKTRGSNYLGQLTFSKSSLKVIDIYCGKLFTALHYENGRIEVLGIIADVFSKDFEAAHTAILNENHDQLPLRIKRNHREKVLELNFEFYYDFHWAYTNRNKTEFSVIYQNLIFNSTQTYLVPPKKL